MTDDDRDTLEGIVQRLSDAVGVHEICARFSRAVADLWCVDPARALEALAVGTEAIAAQVIARRPEHGDAVVARLQQIVTNVAAAIGHNEVKH
jgi:hypothetical protein